MHPLLKKILDPPLHLLDFGKTLWESSKIFVEHGLHVIGVQFLNTGVQFLNSHAPHTVAAFKTIVLSTNECLYSKIQIHFKKKQLQPEVLPS